MEQLAANLSAPLRVVGIADPMVAKAAEALAARRANADAAKAALYAETAVFADYKQMLAEAKPNVVFVGVPPAAHGMLAIANDMFLRFGQKCLTGVNLHCRRPGRRPGHRAELPARGCARAVGEAAVQPAAGAGGRVLRGAAAGGHGQRARAVG